MTFRSRLLFFGIPLLEIVTAYLVGLWIGWGWMLLLLLAGIPIGFALMRRAGNAAMRDLQPSAAAGREPDAGRHALTFVGGLMFVVPGFWSDLLGLLLVLPPTQRLFRQRTVSWFEAHVSSVRMPGVHYPGDVIQGTVIRTDPDGGGAPPPGPPALP